MKTKKTISEFKELSRDEMKSINGGAVVIYRDKSGKLIIKIK